MYLFQDEEIGIDTGCASCRWAETIVFCCAKTFLLPKKRFRLKTKKRKVSAKPDAQTKPMGFSLGRIPKKIRCITQTTTIKKNVTIFGLKIPPPKKRRFWFEKNESWRTWFENKPMGFSFFYDRMLNKTKKKRIFAKKRKMMKKNLTTLGDRSKKERVKEVLLIIKKKPDAQTNPWVLV